MLATIPAVRVKPDKKRYAYYHVLQVDYGPQDSNDEYRTWVDIMETRDWGAAFKARKEMKEDSNEDLGMDDKLGQLEFRIIQRRVEVGTGKEGAM